MKKKLKLNFDQLEKEMGLQDNILTSPVDLSSISGGSNIYEIMAYFESLGFIFERGSDGNYYGSQCITLDPVTVTARVGSGNNVTNVPFDYGTGYIWNTWNNWNQTGNGGGGGGTGTSSWPGVPYVYYPGSGYTSGSSTTITQPTLVEEVSLLGYNSKTWRLDQNTAYAMMSAASNLNNYVGGGLSLGSGIFNAPTGVVTGLLTMMYAGQIGNIQDAVHYNGGENVLVTYTTNFTGDGGNIACALTLVGESSGTVYGSITW